MTLDSRRLALVAYLGKYLAKGFSEDRTLNARRFRSSLGIDVPFKVVTLPHDCRGDVELYAYGLLHEAAGSVGYHWRAEDMMAGWLCSW